MCCCGRLIKHQGVLEKEPHLAQAAHGLVCRHVLGPHPDHRHIDLDPRSPQNAADAAHDDEHLSYMMQHMMIFVFERPDG